MHQQEVLLDHLNIQLHYWKMVLKMVVEIKLKN